MKVVKPVRSTVDTMFRAKLYIFFSRSLWIYLAACIVIAYFQPLYNYSKPLSAAIYFVCISIIALSLYYLSAMLLAKKSPLSANLVFDEDSIAIDHLATGEIEIKGWNWIKKIDLRNNGVYLVAKDKRRMVIFLDRLTTEEFDFFTRIKTNLNK